MKKITSIMYDCIGNIDDSVYDNVYYYSKEIRLRLYITNYFNKEFNFNIKWVLFKDGLFNE
jgi:hypothetical protein